MKRYLFIIILFTTVCFSQNPQTVVDTTSIYHNINNFSEKNKLSKFFYKLIFRASALEKKTVEKVKKEENFSSVRETHNDKIIRNIKINCLDPFGYSVSDSTQTPNSKFEKFGNSIHIKTKEFTIKNLLLFKKYDSYDYLKIKESERLIRSQRYTRRVKIDVVEIPNVKDSVDLTVNVLDSWSLIPNGSVSSSQGSVNLRERNVLGLGHQIYGQYKERFEDNENAISAQYSINNVKNSFLRFDLNYDNDFDNNSRRRASLNRAFYSPLTKWAGGISFENKTQNEFFNLIITDSLIKTINKSEHIEYWLGRSFKLFQTDDYNHRTSRLITAIAMNTKNYIEKPSKTIDPSGYFTDERNILIHFGINAQKYYQDKFIFNYDIKEDVPYGEVFAIVLGHQVKNNATRHYFGSKAAIGKKFNFGYLSGNTEWGSFFKNSNAMETAFRFEINYFTNLIHLGNWRIRQFIKPTYIWGNNRQSSEKDQLTLNEGFGIQGFNSPITGTQKWLLNMQTQTYTPGDWHGFRFSPYVNATFGALANSKNNLFSSKIYSKFGIGVLINNDYLVFNSFQISFSYYPSIPFEGDNIIKTNSFENTDLSLPDYQLNKPNFISYQ